MAGGAAVFLPWQIGDRLGPRRGACGAARRPGHPTVRNAAAHPAGHAAGRQDQDQGRRNIDYYEISVRQFAQQILPGGPAGDDGLGLRRRHVAPAGGPVIHQRAVADDRGEVRTGRSGSSGSTSSVDADAATTCRTCCRSTRRCTGRTRRAARPGRDTRPDVHGDARPIHRPGADRHARPRRRRRRRRERRLRGGVVPAGGRATSPPATPREGTWYDFFRGKAAARLLAAVDLGPGIRHLPVPERAAARRRSGTTTTRSA